MGYGKDWLAKCHANVTEWDIRSQCLWPDIRVEEYYKVNMSAYSQVGTCPYVALDVKLQQPIRPRMAI